MPWKDAAAKQIAGAIGDALIAESRGDGKARDAALATASDLMDDPDNKE